MELSYSSELIRDLCLREQIAIKELGEEVAGILFSRIADMRAAENPLELPAGDPHPLDPPNSDKYTVSLGPSHRLLFCSNHSKHRNSNEEEMDWHNVFRVQVIEITGI